MKPENVYAYGYARMPRVIRKGYQQLTKLQKLLYIYLRDLCGEDGVCYRSLRALSKETDFSVGYLSTNIPVLHNEDLIHASMRKHHGTGWEIWHISIVDIWEKNAAFIQAEKEKCSQDEQSDLESVHAMNKNVHHMNRIDESVHPVNESVHAMTLNREPNRELDITENTDREVEGANAPTPAHLIRNEYGELIEVPDDLAEKALASQRKVLDLPEPNIPTPAHLKEVVDEKIEEVQRITDKHKAVQANDTVSHSHSHSAIGNERVDTPGRLTLPSKDKIGATHAATNRPGLSGGRSAGSAADDRDSVASLEHTPGTPTPLPLAVAPPRDRHGDATSDQAPSRSLLPSEPAQADFPPAGSVASGTTTAQASGFTPPKRPRGKQPVVSLSLMGSEVMQWIGEIRGAKPRMTSGNVRACNALAECDGMSKEALAAYFASIEAQNREVDLLTAAGETGNDKVGFLSFESNWPKLKKKLKGKPPGEVTYAENDYSIKAQMWRQEHMARSGK